MRFLVQIQVFGWFLLGIPCLTLRDNTERPITVEKGTNKIIGNEESKIVEEFNEIINGKINSHDIPELWDGNAAERIIEIINEKIINDKPN